MRFLYKVAILSTALLLTPQASYTDTLPKDESTAPQATDEQTKDAAPKEPEPAPDTPDETPAPEKTEPAPDTPDETPAPEKTEPAPDMPAETPAPEKAEPAPDMPTETPADKKSEIPPQKQVEKKTEETRNWRKDPSVRRHPGSYLGGSIGYAQSRAWYVPQEKEFDEDLQLGPINAIHVAFRVGDAFFEWLAIGFHIDIISGRDGETSSMSAMGLLLDTTFYPWQGLGLRPSVGLGFSFADGKEDYEFGFGGPGDLSFAVTYEIRLKKLLVLAPIAQVSWIFGEDYNGVFFCVGIEILKWFQTATG